MSEEKKQTSNPSLTMEECVKRVIKPNTDDEKNTIEVDMTVEEIEAVQDNLCVLIGHDDKNENVRTVPFSVNILAVAGIPLAANCPIEVGIKIKKITVPEHIDRRSKEKVTQKEQVRIISILQYASDSPTEDDDEEKPTE